MTIRSWALLAVLAASACDTTVGHSNPYDPSTPPSQQAKAKLVGRVLFEDKAEGDDRSGTRVSVKGLPSVFTAADGSYAVPDVPAGTWAVEAFSEGYELGSAFPVLVTLSPDSAQVAVPDITLRRARNTVRGVALLQAASRHSGIAVSLTPGGGATHTDEAGNFVLAQVPTGTYEVVFAKAGFSEVRRSAVPVAATGLTVLEAVTLELRKDASISGTVSLELAASPTTASVKLTGTDVNGAALEANTAPGATGGFRFDGLPAGTYWVQVSEPSYAPVQLPTVVLGPGQSFDLQHAALTRLRGSLGGRYALSQAKSHEGIQVGVQGLGALAPVAASTFTDTAGAFSFLSLPVGTYQVTAHKGADWSSDDQTVEVKSDAPGKLSADPVALTVVATARVVGAVLVDKGPSAGTQVRLRGTDVRGLEVDRSTDTGSDGAFGFDALVSGAYQLSYERASFEPASTATFVVGTGETVTAPQQLLRVRRGDVSGTVALSAGAVTSFQVGSDASGVRVELDDENGDPVAATVTDSGGRFQFAQVAVSVVALGKHRVKAAREHFSPASHDFTLVADTSNPVGPVTLTLSAGSLEGKAYLNDKLDASGRLASHVGVSVSVAGVAYNGVAYSKAGGQSAADGTWSLTGLPPGTYEVQLTATHRRCEGGGTFPVRPGEAVPTGEADCYDTVAPGPVVLASVPAWSLSDPLPVAILTAAADTNLRGYQAVQGRLPDWSQAAAPAPASSFDFDLDPKEERTLWVRAVDWCGNAGPETYVTSRLDEKEPATPSIHIPRETAGADGVAVSYLNATTTSVTLTGAEGDSTFETYLACSHEMADLTTSCPASPLCELHPEAATFVLQLKPGKRTCVWARSRDLAQRPSPGTALASAVCDTDRPTSIKVAPVYESSQFTVRASSVDVFVEAGPTDAPLGDLNSPFKGVDFLEVDSGGGFLPLCPGCRAQGAFDTWDPCSPTCTCADPRLVCSTDVKPTPAVDAGSAPGPDAGWAQSRRFVAVRVPLSPGTLNRLSVRAVDLAGNSGDGAVLTVGTEGTRTFAQGTGSQAAPRFYKDMVAFSSGANAQVYRLGKDRRPETKLLDATSSSYEDNYMRSRSCGDSSSTAEAYVAIGEAGTVFSAGSTRDRKLDLVQYLAPGVFPPAMPLTLRTLVPSADPVSNPFVANLASAGKFVAWVETQDAHPTLPNPRIDQKEVWVCQPEPMPAPTGCTPLRLGSAAGKGHVSGLRAGGDWLLWAESLLPGTDCSNAPVYRWRLAYLEDPDPWMPATHYRTGQLVRPTTANGHVYRAVGVPEGQTGMTPGGEPNWPTDPGATVAGGSNGLVWREMTATFDAEQAAVSADGTLVFTADNGRDEPWQPNHLYSTWQLVRASGRLYRVMETRGATPYLGKSGAQAPAWSTEAGVRIPDGELTWTLWESTELMSTPVTYRIYSAGPDGLWNTGDEPAPVVNVASTEVAQGGLAIERGRALAFGYGVEGSIITLWEAAPSGRFVGDPSYLRHIPAAGGEPRGPEVAQGLFVYAYGSGNRADLVAMDLSTVRWESVGDWHELQAIADDGTVLYADDDLFEKRIVARRADGSESSLALPKLATGMQRNAPAFIVTGEDLLFQCWVGASLGLCATNAGLDHRFFTGDEPAPVVLAKGVLPTDFALEQLVGGGGNAFYVVDNGSALSGFLLQPAAPPLGKPGGPSLVYAAPQAVAAADGFAMHSYLAPAVSESLLFWAEEKGTSTAFRIRHLTGTPFQENFVPTVYDPLCTEVKRVAVAGPSLLLYCGNKTFVSIAQTASAMAVISGKLVRRLALGDLVPQDDGGRPGIAFSGDRVAFLATTAAESAQLYTWDRSRDSLVQRSAHFSDKSSLQMAPSGRMVWRDSLFNGFSTFVFLP